MHVIFYTTNDNGVAIVSFKNPADVTMQFLAQRFAPQKGTVFFR